MAGRAYRSRVPGTLDDFAAVLFDLDGVHHADRRGAHACVGQMFDAFLAGREGQQPYTDADYFAYVDGKPRYDGVR